jgi:hypothetical protein
VHYGATPKGSPRLSQAAICTRPPLLALTIRSYWPETAALIAAFVKPPVSATAAKCRIW